MMEVYAPSVTPVIPSPPGLPAERQQALRDAYAAIQKTHFADVPVCNPALEVEAVAFQALAFAAEEGDAGWLGAVITPWSLIAVWLPADAASLAALPLASTVIRTLPAGDCPFTVEDAPAVGRFLASPLFSPLHTLRSQEQAQDAATLAITLLLQEASEGEKPEKRPEEAAASAAEAAETVASPGRRTLFRGLLNP